MIVECRILHSSQERYREFSVVLHRYRTEDLAEIQICECGF